MFYLHAYCKNQLIVSEQPIIKLPRTCPQFTTCLTIDLLTLQEDARKRKERAEEEWREYEEIRRAEREKEEEEIRQLRERRVS